MLKLVLLAVEEGSRKVEDKDIWLKICLSEYRINVTPDTVLTNCPSWDELLLSNLPAHELNDTRASGRIIFVG